MSILEICKVVIVVNGQDFSIDVENLDIFKKDEKPTENMLYRLDSFLFESLTTDQ